MTIWLKRKLTKGQVGKMASWQNALAPKEFHNFFNWICFPLTFLDQIKTWYLHPHQVSDKDEKNRDLAGSFFGDAQNGFFNFFFFVN